MSDQPDSTISSTSRSESRRPFNPRAEPSQEAPEPSRDEPEHLLGESSPVHERQGHPAELPEPSSGSGTQNLALASSDCSADAAVPESSGPSTANADASVPESSGPSTANADASVPESSGPSTAIADASVPESSGPSTDDADASVPESSGPSTDDADASVPESSGPSTDDADASVPESSGPSTDDADASVPESSGPSTANADASVPESSGPSANEDASVPESSGPSTDDADASVSESSGPSTANADASVPESSGPSTGDADASVPESSDPSTANAGASVPESSGPSTANADASVPESSGPSTANAGASVPESSGPSTANADASVPESSGPSTANADASVPESSGPSTANADASVPESSGPSTANADASVPESSSPLAIGSRLDADRALPGPESSSSCSSRRSVLTRPHQADESGVEMLVRIRRDSEAEPLEPEPEVAAVAATAHRPPVDEPESSEDSRRVPLWRRQHASPADELMAVSSSGAAQPAVTPAVSASGASRRIRQQFQEVSGSSESAPRQLSRSPGHADSTFSRESVRDEGPASSSSVRKRPAEPPESEASCSSSAGVKQRRLQDHYDRTDEISTSQSSSSGAFVQSNVADSGISTTDAPSRASTGSRSRSGGEGSEALAAVQNCEQQPPSSRPGRLSSSNVNRPRADCEPQGSEAVTVAAASVPSSTPSRFQPRPVGDTQGSEAMAAVERNVGGRSSRPLSSSERREVQAGPSRSSMFSGAAEADATAGSSGSVSGVSVNRRTRDAQGSEAVASGRQDSETPSTGGPAAVRKVSDPQDSEAVAADRIETDDVAPRRTRRVEPTVSGSSDVSPAKRRCAGDDSVTDSRIDSHVTHGAEMRSSPPDYVNEDSRIDSHDNVSPEAAERPESWADNSDSRIDSHDNADADIVDNAGPEELLEAGHGEASAAASSEELAEDADGACQSSGDIQASGGTENSVNVMSEAETSSPTRPAEVSQPVVASDGAGSSQAPEPQRSSPAATEPSIVSARGSPESGDACGGVDIPVHVTKPPVVDVGHEKSGVADDVDPSTLPEENRPDAGASCSTASGSGVGAESASGNDAGGSTQAAARGCTDGDGCPSGPDVLDSGCVGTANGVDRSPSVSGPSSTPVSMETGSVCDVDTSVQGQRGAEGKLEDDKASVTSIEASLVSDEPSIRSDTVAAVTDGEVAEVPSTVAAVAGPETKSDVAGLLGATSSTHGQLQVASGSPGDPLSDQPLLKRKRGRPPKNRASGVGAAAGGASGDVAGKPKLSPRTPKSTSTPLRKSDRSRRIPQSESERIEDSRRRVEEARLKLAEERSRLKAQREAAGDGATGQRGRPGRKRKQPEPPPAAAAEVTPEPEVKCEPVELMDQDSREAVQWQVASEESHSADSQSLIKKLRLKKDGSCKVARSAASEEPLSDSRASSCSDDEPLSSFMCAEPQKIHTPVIRIIPPIPPNADDNAVMDAEEAKTPTLPAPAQPPTHAPPAAAASPSPAAASPSPAAASPSPAAVAAPPAVDEESQLSTGSKKGIRCEIFEPGSQCPLPADQLFEYRWPREDPSAEMYLVQEQICSFLDIVSFKRRYPDIQRRTADADERQYLLDRKVITASQMELGVTALRSSDVLDLMFQDFPEMYEQFQRVIDQRKLLEVQKSQPTYTPAEIEQNRVREFVQQAARQAAAWNVHMNRERRDERRYGLDLQTYTVHGPRHASHNPASAPATGDYPVAVLPTQYCDHYKRYSANDLRYLPLNTILGTRPLEEIPSDASDSESDESSSDDSSSSSGDSSDGTQSDQDSQPDVQPTRANSLCRVCNGQTGHTEMLSCSKCGVCAHPQCVQLTADVAARLHGQEWQCTECKTCVACGTADDEDKMIFCDLCDRGYHIYCVGLRRVPVGRWHCAPCSHCQTCGTSDPAGGLEVSELNNRAPEWAHQYRRCMDGTKVYLTTLCIPCDRLWKKLKYCPICNKCYTTTAEELATINCSTCSKSAHKECMGSLGRGDAFICQDCQDKRQLKLNQNMKHTPQMRAMRLIPV